ncbi:gp53-like domain-containing protein [Escherichia coli]|uniref:gp53-like domain-containing protein n=1 Tax=Escherichia coli TaxID=562 RepID=UPI003262FD7E
MDTVATQPSLDWQQFDFVTAGNYLVIFSNMTNVPAGVSYTTGTYLWVRTLGANGQSITIEVIPATSVDSNFKIYEVLINGAKGARTFSVRQAFTSANTIPFANLAVGTAAKLAAAVAVQGVSGYLIIPALVGGVEKNTIIQWGAFAGVSTGDTPVTFPFPFPNAVRHVYPCAQALGTGAYAGYNTPTKTGFNGNMWSSSNTRQPGNSSYLAIGE